MDWLRFFVAAPLKTGDSVFPVVARFSQTGGRADRSFVVLQRVSWKK
jgi:hypothetical protein